jgi:Pyruvate/2-oxoacid:ferredoxin oxidoreductase delta subunit
LIEKGVVSGRLDAAAQRKMRGLSRRAFLRGAWKPSSERAEAAAGPVAIGAACLALNRVVCRSCAEHCAAHAIHFRLAPGGIAVPLVRNERCNGCAACIAVCPTSAISMQAAASNVANEEAA